MCSRAHAQYSRHFKDLHVEAKFYCGRSCLVFESSNLLGSLMATAEPDSSSSKSKRRLSLSLKKRFTRCTTEELETASKKKIPKNTSVAVNWAFRVFSDWVKVSSDVEGREFEVQDLWSHKDPAKLCEMLCCFCLEVKQQNGDSYTPKSVLQIFTNLQKYAREQDSQALHFMNQQDEHFTRLHIVLDNLSRQLHKEGIGASKAQARVVTSAEEEKLWDSNVIGVSSPESLFNAVFFYCGIYLCLRGGEEHRQLKLSQFVIEEVENPHNPQERIKCLRYTEHGSKNHSGSLHHVHLTNKAVQHYANSSLGDRCFVYLVDLYMSKLPVKAFEKDIFYCKPAKNIPDVGKPWYFDTAVGHNTLKKKLKDIYSSAGLDTSAISNHSLRATSVTRLYEKGVPEKMIMERSGHLSTSGVRSYERTSEFQKKSVSDALSSSSIQFESRKPLENIMNTTALLENANDTVSTEQMFDTAMTHCKSFGDNTDLTDTANETVPIERKFDTTLTTVKSENKENAASAAAKVSDVMKQFSFGNLDGCTFNFNFN